MNKNEIFFSADNGLTSTSANHIANLAKEYVSQLERKLNNIQFVNSCVTLVGTNEKNELTRGISSSDLADIPDSLQRISSAKSLIAWLREAIKAREQMLRDVNAVDEDDFYVSHNIAVPSRPESPTKEEVLTEDDVIATLSIKDRNRILTLNTECAVIGKFIHLDGRFADERDNLMDKITNPNDISGSGRDALIYKFAPSVSLEEVEDLFFKLQARHREIESELNGYKHKISLVIERDTLDKNAKYENDIAEYKRKYDEYSIAVSEIQAKYSSWKKEESIRVGNLKIIIPNDLLSVYNEISALGKK